MLRFAANLSMMYPEFSFLDRFGAAAADGMHAVEYLFPYDHPASDLARLLKSHRLEQVLFNAPPGSWDSGERGFTCLAHRQNEFRTSINRALEYAEILECPRIHVMAGIAPSEAPRSALRDVYISNIAWAAEQAMALNKVVLIEPINPYDMPGYFLNRQDEAHAIVAEVAMPNLKVQMDLYHCARVEGDVVAELRKWLDPGARSAVGHIQIAGVPGRNEPDSGSLNFDAIFDLIEQSHYTGWIGCEYRPKHGTSGGLGWLRRRMRHSL